MNLDKYYFKHWKLIIYIWRFYSESPSHNIFYEVYSLGETKWKNNTSMLCENWHQVDFGIAHVCVSDTSFTYTQITQIKISIKGLEQVMYILGENKKNHLLFSFPAHAGNKLLAVLSKPYNFQSRTSKISNYLFSCKISRVKRSTECRRDRA